MNPLLKLRTLFILALPTLKKLITQNNVSITFRPLLNVSLTKFYRRCGRARASLCEIAALTGTARTAKRAQRAIASLIIMTSHKLEKDQEAYLTAAALQLIQEQNISFSDSQHFNEWLQQNLSQIVSLAQEKQFELLIKFCEREEITLDALMCHYYLLVTHKFFRLSPNLLPYTFFFQKLLQS